VLSFHPERARPKVEFLLNQASVCPVAKPPPMTMIINIPERVLLIKVARTTDAQEQPSGYVLVFYDITDVVAANEQPVPDASAVVRRQLQKIPAVSGQNISLIEVEDVLRLNSDGHYTRVITAGANQFCNLSIGDLEARLDAEHFMRVHRSHIVNLRHVVQLLRVDGRLVLRLRGDETDVPVSRTSGTALMARLGITAASVPAHQG
jgi:LytTR family transcriptional regulator, CO-responsive transcriptional regulator RcoM